MAEVAEVAVAAGKKAIIFDIDGTAMPIGEGNWPSERLAAAIKSLQTSYHLSTATGRSSEYVLEIIKFLGLRDDCIIAAGTEIYDPINRKIVWVEKIPEHTYKFIEQALSHCKSQVFSGQTHEGGHTANHVHELLADNVSVLYVIATEESEAETLLRKLQHPDLQIINMHSYWNDDLRDIHIHSAKASKEHAVAELLKRLDVRKEDSIVIGDGLNDTHLFAAGGLRVAMGNARAELKKQADMVIDDVAEDGLAVYLESFINSGT